MTKNSPSFASNISSKTVLTRLVTGVVLINLFVIFLMVVSLRQSRIQYQERAVISTTDISELLEQNLVSTIEKIDLALQTVADEAEHQVFHGGIDTDIFNEFIARQYGRIPELDGLRMTNAHGEVVFGTGVKAGSLHNMSDRDYFVHARNNDQQELFISKPFFGRIAQKWVLNISQRINNPDGSFNGVVYAAIALEHFQKTFARVNVGSHGSIVLRDAEMGFIARYPEKTQIDINVGQKSVSQKLQEQLHSGSTAGTYTAFTGPDQIERTVTYRKVGAYPLYVIVSFAKKDYLAHWQNIVKLAVALTAAFALISSVVTWFLYRNWLRRVTAINELIASKEQIHILLESTAEAIYGVDMHGYCTFANPACVRLLGFDHAEELLGKQLHNVCHHTHPDGTPFPMNECRISNSFKDGIAVHVDDEVFWRKDGSCFPIECWSYPQVRNNEVIGAVVTFIDITERKRAEAELQESRQELADIIDFLPDATFVIDTQGKVIAWNKAIEVMSGVSKADMLGQGDHACTIPFYGVRRPHLLDLLDIDDEELKQKYQHIQRKGNTLNAETFTPAIYGGKGAYVWAMGAPLYNTKGERVGAIEAIRDISEQKRAEATINRYSEHLEELVEQRTQELLIAKEVAEIASRSKSEFLATMSHEFRTPLNTIIGFSDLALQNGLSAKQQHFMHKIQYAGKALLIMITEILDFSRSEAGILELSQNSFQLDEILSQVIVMAQQKALEKRLDFLVSIPPQRPLQLNGDSERLVQVLSSLLDNAVKFTVKGEIELKLKHVEHIGETVQLCFQVRDSGIGIRPEQLEKLFQPFSQADGSSTRTFGGTGVGLTLCRRLATLMGGDITVESTPDKGCTFTFIAHFDNTPAPDDKTLQSSRNKLSSVRFPWIETVYTLAWVTGHEKLYRNLMDRFEREHHDIVANLTSAITRADYPEAVKISHTLAGLAGALGVTKLKIAAMEMEQALSHNRDIPATLDRLASVFSEFTGNLANESGNQNKPTVSSVTENDIKALLCTLEQHTRDYDGEASGYFESIVTTLKTALPVAPWNDIAQLLETYEFDEVTELVRGIINGLEK